MHIIIITFRVQKIFSINSNFFVESQQIFNSKITTKSKDKVKGIVAKLLKILYFFVVMIVNERNLSNIF